MDSSALTTTMQSPIVIILGVVLLAVGVYFGYNYIQKKRASEPVYITKPVYSKEARIIPALRLPNIGADYTISFWIYVHSYIPQLNQHNTILEWGSLKDKRVQPWVGFSNKPNKPLTVGLTLRNGTLSYHEIDTIPVRKWVHVIITTSSDVCTVYLNGKMEKVIRLPHPIQTFPGGDLAIHRDTNKYEGALTQLQLRNYVMSANDIRYEYMRGPAPWRLSPLEWPYIIPRIKINFDFDLNAQ